MEFTKAAGELCQKDAVLNREEGTGYPLDLSHRTVTEQVDETLGFSATCKWSGFCKLKGQLTILVFERSDSYVHTHLDLFRLYLFCHPGEKL